MTEKFGLIILDGWGIGDKSSSDAIYNAKTPYMDSLLQTYSNASLLTSGLHVGLPDGQMGNSEVGHLTIGAGRVVFQELTRINKSIEDGEFIKNKALIDAFEIAKSKGKKLHFLGLVSNGGVHSSQNHLHALCDMAKDYGINNTYIHAITDGRDCDPKSGLRFIEKLENHISDSNIKIASIVGRYYAMDRDNRWERIKKAYDLYVLGKGEHFTTGSEAVESSYSNRITDEFIEPSLINPNGQISNGDVVICFNFRTDRPREISKALTQQDFPEYGMKKLDVSYFTMTNYDDTFNNVRTIFEKENLNNTLGETLAKRNKSQVRIAETEKYPHVTFFFNGGREDVFENESRILVNSPKVATYDMQPEMSALEVRDQIVAELNANQPDFFCLNFANPDMVGHTGVYEAIIQAVETVDSCLSDVIESGKKLGYEFLVIADHGNADFAINLDGSPNTAHSLNPVPMVLVSTDESCKLIDGSLADVAPTILNRLGIEQPEEMTGIPLFKS